SFTHVSPSTTLSSFHLIPSFLLPPPILSPQAERSLRCRTNARRDYNHHSAPLPTCARSYPALPADNSVVAAIHPPLEIVLSSLAPIEHCPANHRDFGHVQQALRLAA